MMHNQNEDFEFDELDPVEKAKLQEAYDEELEEAMRTAFGYIEDVGEESWLSTKGIPVSSTRKKTILTNMMNWFADPRREEYEKSAKLQRMISRLDSQK